MSEDRNEPDHGIAPRRRGLLKTVGLALVGGTGSFSGTTAGESAIQATDKTVENRTRITQQQTEWRRSFEHGYSDITPVSESNGGGSILVFDNTVKKLNENGDEQWTRSYGNPDRSPDISSITEASTGGFLFAGNINPEEGNLQPSWVVKIAADGTKQWETTENLRGGPQAYDQRALDIIGTEDGGFVVSIGSYNNISLIKVDEAINREWIQSYSEFYQSVKITRAGNFLVSFGGPEHGLTKVSSEGTELWTKTYGPERYYTAPIDTGDGYLLAGTTDNYPLENVELLMKIAPGGSKEWEKLYESLEGKGITDLAQGERTGFVLAGYEEHDQEKTLPWLMKVDADGGREGEQTPDFPTGIDKVYKLSDGSYLLSGGGDGSWVARRSLFDSTPPDVNGDGNVAQDPDGDGLYEDVNGDGDVNVGDPQALFNNSDSDSVQDHLKLFDFNSDQSLNVGDAQALFDEVTKGY